MKMNKNKKPKKEINELKKSKKLKHEKCIDTGFMSTLLPIMRTIQISQNTEVLITFKERCKTCGEIISKETQCFKYTYTMQKHKKEEL